MAQDRSEPPNKDYSVQRLLLGTHTSEGEQNYLMRAQVQLPLEDTETDARQYDEVRLTASIFRRAFRCLSAECSGVCHSIPESTRSPDTAGRPCPF